MGTPTIVVTQNGNQLHSGKGPVTVGGRVGCDVVVDDAVVADRHLQVAFDGVFTVRDLGTVSGTWLDGKRVTAPTPIRDGAMLVFGTSVLRCKLAEGEAQLELELERQAFWWKKPGKGAFDNDPDAMVRREVGFGRFPLLHAANRVAIVAASVLVIAAVFVAAVMDPLADPGPLQPSHALVLAAAAGTARPATCTRASPAASRWRRSRVARPATRSAVVLRPASACSAMRTSRRRTAGAIRTSATASSAWSPASRAARASVSSATPTTRVAMRSNPPVPG